MSPFFCAPPVSALFTQPGLCGSWKALEEPEAEGRGPSVPSHNRKNWFQSPPLRECGLVEVEGGWERLIKHHTAKQSGPPGAQEPLREPHPVALRKSASHARPG